MGQSRASKKFMNMAYGLGASIVIVGALFKIIHFEIGPLTGNVMLTIGLVTEAIIFAISAFEPVDDDLDWSLVYPELAGAESSAPTVDSISATKKYSEEIAHAAAQMESLNSLYRVQLESANRQATINEESVENAAKLKEQMQSLASHLSSLNGVYGGMLSAMNKS
ncbi:MAG: gliding motility protein GldL [Flavobacteriaceae bacterium]